MPKWVIRTQSPQQLDGLEGQYNNQVPIVLVQPVTIHDPQKNEKMAAIRKALDECSIEHPVFYEDEVDIHLNPKIGADWQVRGRQKRVVTPGQNETYYLAGE